MNFLSFLVWIILSWVSIQFIISFLRRKKLPPGPFPLPIVGNLFMIGKSPHKSFTDLAKIYGPVMSLKFGSQNTVVVTSSSLAKEVLHKNDAASCSRTLPDCWTAHQHDKYSMLFLPIGDLWRTLRKVSNYHVFSKSRLDASQYLRKKKLEDLVCYVKSCSRAGEAVEIGQVAFKTSLNLLSNTFFSVDIADLNSVSSNEFKETVWQIMMELTKPNLADYFPVLKFVDPMKSKQRMGVHFKKMIDLFTSMVSQRLVDKNGSLDENDALDALLKISHENSQEFPLSHIPHLLLELFVAGTDTTANSIEWAMAELLSHPDKLKNAREEIEAVVGKGNPVKEEDVAKLPYLQAAIKETFRRHGPAPFIYRRAVSDIELNGFTVPGSTQILINLWGMGKDSTLWKDPELFEPERFIGTDIDVKGRDFELLPFGSGRRICPGLPLAIRMIPLTLGSLINCFEWKLADGVIPETMDMDAKFGMTLLKAQPLRAIPTTII